MDDAMNEAIRSRLEQIADALRIPVATFLAPAREPVNAAVARGQEEELLRLFRETHDPDLRAQVLDFLRAVGGGSQRSKG